MLIIIYPFGADQSCGLSLRTRPLLADCVLLRFGIFRGLSGLPELHFRLPLGRRAEGAQESLIAAARDFSLIVTIGLSGIHG
jgi:hypothetical protein